MPVDDDRELEKALLPAATVHDAQDSESYGQTAKSTSAPAARPAVGVAYAASLIGIWMSLSTAVILWNAKLLLGGFPFPITLS